MGKTATKEKALQAHKCPACRVRLQFGEPLAGRWIRCPDCKEPIRLPGKPNAKPTQNDGKADASKSERRIRAERHLKTIEAEKHKERVVAVVLLSAGAVMLIGGLALGYFLLD